MPRDRLNIIPASFAVILHVVIAATLLIGFDWSRAHQPDVPLAIKATIVTPNPVIPQVVKLPEPEPEPEPELPQPDPDEDARREAEEQKRLEDERVERERVEAERLEQQRIQREKEAAERKRAEEERIRREKELEEQRRKAEELRKQKEEEQRRQNELEREMLARQQQELLQAEQERLEAQNSTEMQVYLTRIKQKVTRSWARPGTARDDLSCVAVVDQQTGGIVIDVRITDCNGDEIVKRSIVSAINRASPLPTPENPLLFVRTFEIEFTIHD